MLMMSARLFSTMYWIELVMPSTRNVGRANHEIDVRIGRHAAGDFHVKIGFAVVAGIDAVVLARMNKGRIVGRKIEQLAIALHVAQQNVGAAHNRDRLAGSVDPRSEQRRGVVNRGEVRRRNVMDRTAGSVFRAVLDVAEFPPGS
jgi:hypothetical protein